jgi:membrane protease YdiL (CAAX protease family)
MQKPRPSRQQVAIYLLLVFLFSSVFYFLMLRAHSLAGGGGLYVTGIMWCPALAGMLTLKLNGRNLSDLGWKWPGTKFAAMSWYLPLLYAAITYIIVWTLKLGAFPNHEFMQSLVGRMGLRLSPALSTVVYVLLMGSIGLVGSLSRALGEEIGWRGFLVPEMSKTMSFTSTALISGIVWSLWHYPILIWGDYNAGTATWYSLTCFTVMVVAISFAFAWMRLKSGSLWTGAILHASHNLYIQAIFTPLTRDTGKTAWYIDEFGAVLPIVAVLFAIYFWRRRKEVTAQSGTEAATLQFKELITRNSGKLQFEGSGE